MDFRTIYFSALMVKNAKKDFLKPPRHKDTKKN